MRIFRTFVLRRDARRLGWPGAIGLGGLAVALVMYLWAVQPAQRRLEAALQRVSALQQRLARPAPAFGAAGLPLEQQLAEFYRMFPNEQDVTGPIGKIAAIARRNGLPLQAAEYRTRRDARLTRLQMDLQLKGGYQAIRRFLAEAGAEVPTLALEQVQFERHKIGDAKVDARVRLVIFLGQPS